MECQRIALWSGPRNVSTALMYAFAQRSDTKVVDEPLFGYFLQHTGAQRPSREESLAVMSTDGPAILQQLLHNPIGKPVYFMKHMANHLVGLDWSFLPQCHNVILTRDPRQMLPSYQVHIELPTMLDVAYEMQTQLLDHLLAKNIAPIVLDSKEVLLDPEGVLRTLCERISIPFETAMLHWPAGARPEDGPWAKYWYHSLHKSTGFGAYQEKTAPFPEKLQPLLEACTPHYERLQAYAIKAKNQINHE